MNKSPKSNQKQEAINVAQSTEIPAMIFAQENIAMQRKSLEKPGSMVLPAFVCPTSQSASTANFPNTGADNSPRKGVPAA